MACHVIRKVLMFSRWIFMAYSHPSLPKAPGFKKPMLSLLPAFP
jgi:hypothetical protein